MGYIIQEEIKVLQRVLYLRHTASRLYETNVGTPAILPHIIETEWRTDLGIRPGYIVKNLKFVLTDTESTSYDC